MALRAHTGFQICASRTRTIPPKRLRFAHIHTPQNIVALRAHTAFQICASLTHIIPPKSLPVSAGRAHWHILPRKLWRFAHTPDGTYEYEYIGSRMAGLMSMDPVLMQRRTPMRTLCLCDTSRQDSLQKTVLRLTNELDLQPTPELSTTLGLRQESYPTSGIRSAAGGKCVQHSGALRACVQHSGALRACVTTQCRASRSARIGYRTARFARIS